MSSSYLLEANQINEYNKELSNLANADTLQANNILLSCKNLSHAVYLTKSACILYSQSVINKQDIYLHGTIPPNINSNNTLGLEQNTQTISTIDSSANIILQEEVINTNTQLNNARDLLNNTKVLVNMIRNKAIFKASLYTLIKYVLTSFTHSFHTLLNVTKRIVSDDVIKSSDTPPYILYLRNAPIQKQNNIRPYNPYVPVVPLIDTEKSFSDAFYYFFNNKNYIVSQTILGSNDLVPYTIYLPTVPLKNSLTTYNNSANIIRVFISSISDPSLYTGLAGLIQQTEDFSSSLDTAARENDLTAYNYATRAKLNPMYMNTLASSIMTPVALASDLSASNSRNISNTLVSIKTAYDNLVTIDDSIKEALLNTLNLLNHIYLLVNPVITNTSEYLATTINTKAYKIIMSELNKITDIETSSFKYIKDITTIYDRIIYSEQLAINTESTDINLINKLLWSVNSIKDEAQTQYNAYENKSLLLNTTSKNIINANTIESQTTYSTTAAKLMENAKSRLMRQSSNLPKRHDIPYTSYKAGIRAKLPLNSTNRPENSFYRTPGEEFNLKSINTVSESLIQITKETQEIKDTSSVLLRKK
jgi:hypothetical protein